VPNLFCLLSSYASPESACADWTHSLTFKYSGEEIYCIGWIFTGPPSLQVKSGEYTGLKYLTFFFTFIQTRIKWLCIRTLVWRFYFNECLGRNISKLNFSYPACDWEEQCCWRLGRVRNGTFQIVLSRLSIRRPSVRPSVCPSVRAITLERFNFFNFCFREHLQGFNSEFKFEYGPRRSTPFLANQVSSKLIWSTGVHAQVRIGELRCAQVSSGPHRWAQVRWPCTSHLS